MYRFNFPKGEQEMSHTAVDSGYEQSVVHSDVGVCEVLSSS